MTDGKMHVSRALSVVVPCFNEIESLNELHRRVTSICTDLTNGDYELVLVNDGSTDGTWDRIVDLSGQDPNVVGVNLSRNHGHQIALTAGLRVCVGRRILMLDADLQDPPELLPEMMKRIDEGADVVFGRRASREGESRFKLASATVFYRVLRGLTETDIPRDTGDFRLITRRCLDVLNAMPEQHRFVRGLVSWIGLKQVPIEYDRQARFAGETKYPFRKMLRFAIDAITGFSIVPLRLASYTGIFFSIMAIAMLIYSIHSWISGGVVRGWTSVMTAVLLLGGVQLLVLGVFGEYLGRLYQQTKGRPLFVIDEIVTSSKPEKESEPHLG